MADTEYDVTVVVNETVNADVGSTQEEGSSQISDNVLSLSAESSEDTIVDAEVATTEAIEVELDEGTGGTADHRKLTHRDATAQHPISAITGLTSSLETLQQSINTGLASANSAIAAVGNVAALAKKYDITEFAASSSNETAPTSGWSAEAPTLDATNKYMWQRISTYEKVSSGSDLYISSTTPELASTMSGLYVFMKQANDGSATVINGGSIIANTISVDELTVGLQDTIENKVDSDEYQNTVDAVASNTSSLEDLADTVAANKTAADTTFAQVAQDIINGSLLNRGKASIQTDSVRVFNTQQNGTYIEITGDALSMLRLGTVLLTLTTYNNKGTVYATDALFSTIKMRASSTSYQGKAGIVGESNGHMSIKAVD